MSELIGSTIVFEGLYQITAASQNLSVPYPFDMFLVSEARTGAATDTQPISDEIEAALTSAPPGSFNRLYLYDRIQIDPALLDLGNLVSAQTQQVSVWNGFFDAKTVTAFDGVGTDGITVVEPYETPYSLASFQQVYYQFSVSLDGPAVVNAVYTVVIGGVAYNIDVTGSRVVLWPFAPNWAAGVNESLEWRTDILTAHSGSEQRIALRSVARRRVEFEFMAREEEAQRLDNILWGWQNRSFAVPLWQYRCRLTAPAAAGASSISLTTANAGFIAGQTAVLMRNPDYYEVIEVLSIASNSITPKRPLELDWSTGDNIYPVAISNFESNVPVTRMTNSVATGRAAFLADPEQTDPFVPGDAATDVYNGYEIVLKQPDWSGGIDNTSEYLSDLVDFGTGTIRRSTTRDTPQLSKRYVWHLRGRAQVAAFRAFLGRLKGRNRAVYLPSWHKDFTLTQDLSPTGTSIFVKDVQYFNLVGADPARAHLMIRTKSGAYFLRPIVGIGKTGDELSINIGTAVGGAGITVTDCLAIHVVVLYRLASDRTVLQWKTDEVTVVDATFLSVKA